ncbi:unnamed protein product [Medioppia subpectinata]|uniref:Translationally-controlled tumor protein homolog n=1 Tax=Medioppia subpectinata TaxID=1979941 RepID=A0A7R9Q8H2_9ACAR|nr:unnamed protein product [Medioppia subpectinata]CAG2115355.1 unnamed protein product [Medioppia subpectinata]
MIIFKDLITGDELFTDSSKVRLVDGCLWEVECRHVTRKQGEIEIAGFNASAEEADEGTDEQVESGLDLVLNQRLVETGFSKSDYKNYLKTYTKSLQDKWKELEFSEDEINTAKTKLTEAVKKVLPKLGDYQFFLGESTNPDGMVGLLEYREKEDGSGETPVMMFFKHGLDEEKFHDREDIRRRLALDSDSEDMSGFRSSRKSSLMSRLQNGQSLQICFMNETTSDSVLRESDYQNEETIEDNSCKTNPVLDNSYVMTTDTNPPKTSPNNNSSLNISDSLNAINISSPNMNRPNHLFTRLDSGSIDLKNYDLFSVIEKPPKKELFSDYHSKLHTEARLALAQLQIIVNDMYSQIESLNTELMQQLVKRDELYMSQDSVLVDIEDLTIFLFSKQ